MRSKLIILGLVFVLFLSVNVSGKVEFVQKQGTLIINQADELRIDYVSNYTNQTNISIYVFHNGANIRYFGGLKSDENGTGYWILPSWYTMNLTSGYYELKISDRETDNTLSFEVRYNQSLAQDRDEAMIYGNLHNEIQRFKNSEAFAWAMFWIVVFLGILSFGWFYKEKWDRTHDKGIITTLYERVDAFWGRRKASGDFYDRGNPGTSTEYNRREHRRITRERKFWDKKVRMLTIDLGNATAKFEESTQVEQYIEKELKRRDPKDPHLELFKEQEKEVSS